MSTRATTATAPAADPMTIPTFAPAVRPGAAVAVELAEDDELVEVDVDELDEPPVAVAAPDSVDAESVAAAVCPELVEVAVDYRALLARSPHTELFELTLEAVAAAAFKSEVDEAKVGVASEVELAAVVAASLASGVDVVVAASVGERVSEVA